MNDYVPQIVTAEDAEQRELDDAARALGAIRLVASYKGNTLKVRACGTNPLASCIEARIAPHLGGLEPIGVERAFRRDVSFRPVKPMHLSRLFDISFRRRGKSGDWCTRTLIAECRFPRVWEEEREVLTLFGIPRTSCDGLRYHRY